MRVADNNVDLGATDTDQIARIDRPRTAPRDDSAVTRQQVQRHALDLDKAASAVSDLLDALGVEQVGEGLDDTPARVARAYAELLTSEPFEATTFPNDEGYDELVLARAIPFSSLCEHHLLPFAGVAHVGYLPGDRLLGLSKLLSDTFVQHGGDAHDQHRGVGRPNDQRSAGAGMSQRATRPRSRCCGAVPRLGFVQGMLGRRPQGSGRSRAGGAGAVVMLPPP